MPKVVCPGKGRLHLGEAGDLAGERAERLQRPDDHVQVSPHALEPAAGEDQRLAADEQRCFS